MHKAGSRHETGASANREKEGKLGLIRGYRSGTDCELHFI